MISTRVFNVQQNETHCEQHSSGLVCLLLKYNPFYNNDVELTGLLPGQAVLDLNTAKFHSGCKSSNSACDGLSSLTMSQKQCTCYYFKPWLCLFLKYLNFLLIWFPGADLSLFGMRLVGCHGRWVGMA